VTLEQRCRGRPGVRAGLGTDRPYTEYFAKQEALVSKVRLNGEADGNYGGFYVWGDPAAMDKFMRSEAAADIIGKALRSEAGARPSAN
jgi:hypothetical protein